MTGAAASTSLVVSSNIGLFGFSKSRSSQRWAQARATARVPWPVTGQVASRPIEAGNKPELHGVNGDGEHDWDAGGGSLSHESRKHPGCDDHSHLKLDQLTRQRW